MLVGCFHIFLQRLPINRSPHLVALWPRLDHNYVSVCGSLFIASKLHYENGFMLNTNESLIKLLNNSTTLSGMPESAAQDIHSLITRTADAYFDISSGSPSTSALYHARFLRNLVDKEVFRTREGMEQGREDRFTIDPGLQGRVPLGILWQCKKN